MKNVVYFSYLAFVAISFLILRTLFEKSVAIEGDVIAYLDIIQGNLKEGDIFEPGSMLIFNTIGLFPEDLHLYLLFFFCFILAVIEGWVILKRCKYPLYWLLFFTICVLPFAHAINLRTGFGIFLIIVISFFREGIGLFLLPLFHSSFLPLFIAWKSRFGKVVNYIGIVVAAAGVIAIAKVASTKLVNYYSGLNVDGSIVGVLIELIMLFLFYYFFKKVYSLHSKMKWGRVFYILWAGAFVTMPLPIVSSRITTFLYVIILLSAFGAVFKTEGTNFFKSNFYSWCFYTLGLLLMVFRIYRIITMFGYLEVG